MSRSEGRVGRSRITSARCGRCPSAGRDRAWVPGLPAAVSWLLLFGYQWAFYFSYRGQQHTVFSYYSGVVGDGFLIPAVNIAAFVMLRQLASGIPWKRVPVFMILGFATATAVNNWSLLRRDSTALKAFAAGWAGLALFAASLTAHYVH